MSFVTILLNGVDSIINLTDIQATAKTTTAFALLSAPAPVSAPSLLFQAPLSEIENNVKFYSPNFGCSISADAVTCTRNFQSHKLPGNVYNVS